MENGESAFYPWYILQWEEKRRSRISVKDIFDDPDRYHNAKRNKRKWE